MEDFHYAGGLPAVMKEIAAHLPSDAPTVWDSRFATTSPDAECFNREVIRTMEDPVRASGGHLGPERQSVPAAAPS